MTAALQKFARIVRAEGLRGLLARLDERRRKHFRLVPCWIISYAIDPAAPLPRPQVDVEIRLLDPADHAAAEDLARIYRVPASAQGILDRMRDRDYCFAAYAAGSPVAYAWFSYKDTVQEFDTDFLRLQPGEVYIHDAYTVPSLRGQSIFPLIKAHGAREMARLRGARSVLSYVKIQNKPSLRASRKLGGRRVGWFLYLRLFGRHMPLELRHKPRPIP